MINCIIKQIHGTLEVGFLSSWARSGMTTPIWYPRKVYPCKRINQVTGASACQCEAHTNVGFRGSRASSSYAEDGPGTVFQWKDGGFLSRKLSGAMVQIPLISTKVQVRSLSFKTPNRRKW